MKRYLASGVISFVLLGMTGCGNQTPEIPELLEPVDLKVDIAEAAIGTVSELAMYNGEVVPYIESVSFAADGSLDQVHVMVGDQVQCGDVLAVLDAEQILEQMDELEKELLHIETLGEFSDRQLELDIEIAKTELLILQENWADEQNLAEKELEIRKLELQLRQEKELRDLEVQEKQNALELLREKEEKTRMTAPFDGTVVYIGEVKSGDLIQAYEPVIYLADDSQLALTTEYIPEYDLRKAERVYAKIMDKEYEISYQPYEDTEYVSMILQDADPKVKFVFENPDDSLESGRYAAVIMVKTYRENVLTIPGNALYQDGAQWYVYRQEDGQRVRCDVTVGAVSAASAEITGGLKEGDLVYVKD